VSPSPHGARPRSPVQGTLPAPVVLFPNGLRWEVAPAGHDLNSGDLRSGLSRLEIADHIGGMGRYVGHLVATMDPTIWIDEVAVTHRILGILLAGRASDFERGPDRSIHIAQQTEREVLGFGELEVLGRCVE